MEERNRKYIIPRFGEFNESELGEISVLHKNGNGTYDLVVDGKSYNANLLSFDSETKQAVVNVNGFKFEVEIKDPLDILVDELGFNDAQVISLSEFHAPMPGLVLDIKVAPGDSVELGDNLIILEAMKMENILKATGNGIVDEIMVEKGEKVEKGQILLKFKALPDQ